MIAIRNGTAKRDLVSLYLQYMNVPAQSLPDTAIVGTWMNHWRLSHVAESARQAHRDRGWPEVAIDDLFKVCGQCGGVAQECIGSGGGYPPPGRPAYSQPLSP